MIRAEMIRVLVNNKVLIEKIKGNNPSDRDIELFHLSYRHHTYDQLKALIMMNTYN